MFLYIIESGRLVKIGITSDLNSRLAALQTANPTKINLVYVLVCKSRDHALALETKFHELLSSYRKNGEWFSIPAIQILTLVQLALALAENVVEGFSFEHQTVERKPVAYKPPTLSLLNATKEQQALAILEANPTLYKTTSRQLAEDYPTISSPTWNRAINRYKKDHNLS